MSGEKIKIINKQIFSKIADFIKTGSKESEKNVNFVKKKHKFYEKITNFVKT